MNEVKVGDIINIEGKKEYYRNQIVTDISEQYGKKIVRCKGWLVFVYADQCNLVKRYQPVSSKIEGE